MWLTLESLPPLSLHPSFLPSASSSSFFLMSVYQLAWFFFLLPLRNTQVGLQDSVYHEIRCTLVWVFRQWAVGRQCVSKWASDFYEELIWPVFPPSIKLTHGLTPKDRSREGNEEGGEAVGVKRP